MATDIPAEGKETAKVSDIYGSNAATTKASKPSTKFPSNNK